VVVEKYLAASEGLDRRSLGRAAFTQRVWAWQADKGATILQQLEEMGASLDWTRTQFTLSPQLSAAVSQAFVTLFDKGKIFQELMWVFRSLPVYYRLSESVNLIQSYL
jgi:valyl-tRNA synthetase